MTAGALSPRESATSRRFLPNARISPSIIRPLMGLAPGSRLGAYDIVSLIGAGGMGEVYRARDSRLQRDVAIKVLQGLVASDHERLARFEQEARATAALNHP